MFLFHIDLTSIVATVIENGRQYKLKYGVLIDVLLRFRYQHS